ncbi:MAG: hypothetical protein H7Z71_05480 [Moraxellaceae bacterium]|nr:hypothetical protein [Pseudobdellovibrionaceae bacterium]
MGTVSQIQLESLFARVDARLNKQLDVFVIGGASAILGYNVSKVTNDVDIDGIIDPDFDKIFREEVVDLKLDLHLSSRGVFYPPEGHRSRSKFKDFPKKNLRVWYLDQYDLAISKIDRGAPKDYEDIQRVHEKSAFDRDRMIQIFTDEYINVVATGNKREKMMNLVDLVLNLFGEDVVEDTQKRIGFKL